MLLEVRAGYWRLGLGTRGKDWVPAGDATSKSDKVHTCKIGLGIRAPEVRTR